MDSSEGVTNEPEINGSTPADFEMPADGLSLRSPDTALAQEERLHTFKIPAALAFARANRLDHVVFGTSEARIGIVTVGKAHTDTLPALADLRSEARRVGKEGVSTG